MVMMMMMLITMTERSLRTAFGKRRYDMMPYFDVIMRCYNVSNEPVATGLAIHYHLFLCLNPISSHPLLIPCIRPGIPRARPSAFKSYVLYAVHHFKLRKLRFLRGILHEEYTKVAWNAKRWSNIGHSESCKKLPGHVFSQPLIGATYHNEHPKEKLSKGQLVQSLQLSATLLHKVRQTGTADTFCLQSRSQGRRHKRETVSRSISLRKQF